MPFCTSRRLLFFTLAIVVVTPIALAQTTTTPGKVPAFEVAAIKPNKTNNGRWRMNFTTDGLTATGVSLQYIVREAYGIYDAHRWSGGPAWVDSDKFDIEAKFDPSEFKSLTLEQRQAMLQELLADRFKLVVHHETRDFPLYALVLAKNGPKLQTSNAENITQSSIWGTMCLHPRGGIGDLAFQGCSMSDLAHDLTSNADVGRTVVDKTGLSGRYDFEYRWTPDVASDPATSDSAGPSIFTALQDQLGLKLESTKGPLDTIVIDHAAMPSEN